MIEVRLQLMVWWIDSILVAIGSTAMAFGELFTALWFFSIATILLVVLVAWGLASNYKEKARYDKMFGEN